jgi:hypothetical protein
MSAEWPLVKAGQTHLSADGSAGPHTWQLLVVEN